MLGKKYLRVKHSLASVALAVNHLETNGVASNPESNVAKQKISGDQWRGMMCRN